jgi:hypothetical protein
MEEAGARSPSFGGLRRDRHTIGGGAAQRDEIDVCCLFRSEVVGEHEVFHL